jgi:hypothetical protein
MQILREQTNLCDDVLGLIFDYLAPNVLDMTIEKYRVTEEIRYVYEDWHNTFPLIPTYNHYVKNDSIFRSQDWSKYFRTYVILRYEHDYLNECSNCFQHSEIYSRNICPTCLLVLIRTGKLKFRKNTNLQLANKFINVYARRKIVV